MLSFLFLFQTEQFAETVFALTVFVAIAVTAEVAGSGCVVQPVPWPELRVVFVVVCEQLLHALQCLLEILLIS